MKVVNGVKVHTLDLTDAQLLVISDALMEMPFKRAAPVVGAINEQLDAEKKDVADAPTS